MTPRYSGSTFVDSLRRIRDIARAIKPALGLGFKQPAPQRHITRPPLHLPFPDDLLEYFEQFDLPPNMRLQLRHRIVRCVQELQNVVISVYERSRQAIPSDIEQAYSDNIRATYESLYLQRHLPRLRETLQQLPGQLGLAKKQPKSTFNSEYIPILEQHFLVNPYPTGPEREELARQTQMTMRQIEVWFQNHRSRARRDGKVIKRPSSKPSHSGLLSSTRGLFEKVETNPLDFVMATPPHAFPTPYQSNFQSTPSTFPQPAWRRRPAAHPISRPRPDLDHLCTAFSKLSLKDGTPRRRHASTPELQCLLPWYNSRITQPPPAPHPALWKASASSTSSTSFNAPRQPPQPSFSEPSSLQLSQVHIPPTTSITTSRFSSYSSSTSLRPRTPSLASTSSLESIESDLPPVTPLTGSSSIPPEDLAAFLDSLFADFSRNPEMPDQLFGYELTIPDFSNPYPNMYDATLHHASQCDPLMFSMPPISLGLLPC